MCPHPASTSTQCSCGPHTTPKHEQVFFANSQPPTHRKRFLERRLSLLAHHQQGNPGPDPNGSLPQHDETSDEPASDPACQVGYTDLIFDLQRLSPDQISQARTEIERILRQNEAAGAFLSPPAQQQPQYPEHQQPNLTSLVTPNAHSRS